MLSTVKKLAGNEVRIAGKWLFNFVLIGIIAGLGSIVFHYLCDMGMHFFLDLMAGYRPDLPAGEHHIFQPTESSYEKWRSMSSFLPANGCLFSVCLVYTYAP